MITFNISSHISPHRNIIAANIVHPFRQRSETRNPQAHLDEAGNDLAQHNQCQVEEQVSLLHRLPVMPL